MGLAIQFPMRLHSLPNMREHWGKRRARAEKHRDSAIIRIGNKMVEGALPKGPPWLVRITRLGPQALDSDNLEASAKSIRDGVADVLGIDDGSDDVLWVYAQEKTRKYQVRIEIFGEHDALLEIDEIHEREKQKFTDQVNQGKQNDSSRSSKLDP